MVNPFIRFKKFIKVKLTLFLYPEMCRLVYGYMAERMEVAYQFVRKIYHGDD